MSYLDGPDPAKKIAVEELERAGFEVDVNESYYEMEMKEMSRFNRYKVMDMPGSEEFKSKYDIVIRIRKYERLCTGEQCALEIFCRSF